MLSFHSCSKKSVEKSVYHWETDYDLTTAEQGFLDSEEITKVYSKFFDITLSDNDEAMPVAKINFVTDPQQEIVPVVYIVTDVFKVLDSNAIRNLAMNTFEQLQALNPQNEFSEIQIDCDWMASIKDKYFYLLEQLKAQMGDTDLSCTLRLYQYKYPTLTGVPPVDKCALMYYNMGDLFSYSENNSILNNDLGEQYLGFGEYPIPLDFALPNFSWTLLYRFGEFQQIISSIDQSTLNDTNLFELQKSNYYSVKMDTFYQGVYLRFGDELRYEYCSEQDLLTAAELLAAEKNQNHTTLLFYDLKPKIANESDKINHVFAAFKQ
jgi:hypothetical protein